MTCTTRVVLVIALAGTSGCALDVPPPLALPAGDVVVFAQRTQPVLDRACASAGCHGRIERPLALYSPGHRRSDPARTFLNESLSDSELLANARAIDAFALEPLRDSLPIHDCLVLRKPLALAYGGAGHEGGELFPSPDDRDYQAVQAYLETLVLPEAP
jgi:hypothetical protein